MAALTLTSAALRCFPTHHLNFASDANNTLWTSAGVVGPGVLGWLNREMYEETGDEVRSQGWTPFVLDTNGNGRRDEWVEPNQPLDPTKDKRIAVTTTAWRSVPLTAQSGAACWAIPAVPCGSCPATIQPTLRSPSSTRCRRPASGRAAATSIQTACSGYPWRAVISAVSTGASAGGR